MRLSRLPLADEEQEAGADVVPRPLPVQQALPARPSLAVEAEEVALIRRVRLPIPLLRREAKRFGMQAARHATLRICAAQPAASTWCETRW
jgi:hypothetical protein